MEIISSNQELEYFLVIVKYIIVLTKNRQTTLTKNTLKLTQKKIIKLTIIVLYKREYKILEEFNDLEF